MGNSFPGVPIAITGMHRSGTSMITRALHDSGLHLIGSGAEDLIDAAEDNPEGFWENKAIVACNDALLEAAGGAWDNPPDLPPRAVDDPRVSDIADASTQAIAALSEHEHWGFKDPRTCLTAAYWLDLEPDLRFIVCVRHPLEVALSLKRRNQNSYSLGLALWERYYATVLELVPADRRIVTHYDTYFVDPEGELGRLCAFAGLEPAVPRVRSDLRHHSIAVDLADAGVSPSLRALYADLCREAGAPLPPAHAADEGRVRRLILDGAVASRYADQRQAAIERLQEREDELRAEEAAREARHRERVRDLEGQVAAARREGTAGAEALKALRASVAEIDARTRTTASRVDAVSSAIGSRPIRKAARRSARTVARTARGAFHRLPDPSQAQLRRVRTIAVRGISDPVPTAKAVARRIPPEARSAATRLPPPAQESLRRGERRFRRAKAAPMPTAKRVARQLPPSTQRLLRHAWRAADQLQLDAKLRRFVRTDAPKPAPVPQGPALREWRADYERMVAAVVPDGAAWLVITPGSPRVTRTGHARATPFPGTANGRPYADDLSAIAHLEAERVAGHRYLVLPEGSRPWFRQQAELRDHVVRSYRTIVDEDGAGAVFDLAEAPRVGGRSLRGEVDRIAASLREPAAVLNWTGHDLAPELPGLATFRPPQGDRLPYLDGTVDIVVVDGSRDVTDARRVASLGVITVGPGASGIEVLDVETRSAETNPERLRVLVWSSRAGNERWQAALAARVGEAGADLRIAEIESSGLATVEDYDVVVVVEPHVLPLPGAIATAAALAAARPRAAVAGKVLRADGRLEAAGGTVFSDRSVALVVGASTDVRGPWHDYVRPVCWAPGLVAAAATLLAEVPGPPALTGRPFLREWCARVWAEGGSVVYHPTVAAVRVDGDGGEPSVPLSATSWQRVLDLRPPRPSELSDGAWRYLLAHDDVEACRG